MDIKIKTGIDDSRISDILLASIELINQINAITDDKTVRMDFADVGFVAPLYVLPLVVFLNGCNRNVEIVNIGGYLENIGFEQGLSPDKMRKSEFLAVMEKYSKRDYIPIISFPATKESDEKDTILSTVESIIIRQSGIAKNVAAGIKYMLGECVDNIIEHANSERGYIVAQSYPDKGYIDICIADNGMTLLGSYRTLADNEIGSDLEAIQAANRGISTKNLPNAENRGYGIITSKKMLVEGLDGSFIMMSGNALHLYNAQNKKFIETPADIRWNGTIVALRIPYVNREFMYINFVE